MPAVRPLGDLADWLRDNEVDSTGRREILDAVVELTSRGLLPPAEHMLLGSRSPVEAGFDEDARAVLTQPPYDGGPHNPSERTGSEWRPFLFAGHAYDADTDLDIQWGDADLLLFIPDGDLIARRYDRVVATYRS